MALVPTTGKCLCDELQYFLYLGVFSILLYVFMCMCTVLKYPYDKLSLTLGKVVHKPKQ